MADTETTSTPITKNFVKSTSNRPPPLQKLHRSYTTIDRDKINKANSGSFNRKFQKPEVTPNTNSSQPGSPKILSLIRVSLKYVHLFLERKKNSRPETLEKSWPKISVNEIKSTSRFFFEFFPFSGCEIKIFMG